MEGTYEIKLDFHKDSDAVNVFKTLLDLQHGIQEYNKALISSISSDIKITSILINVESGSIKTTLQDFVKKLPSDEAIERFIDEPKKEIKNQIKNLLKSAKVKLFEIADLENITQQEKEKILIDDITEIIDNSKLSSYGMKISREKILKSAEEVYKPIRESKNDIYYNQDGNGFRKINKSFNFIIEDSFKETTNINTFKALLVIKKPALVGHSKWEFILDKAIEADMKDGIFEQKLKNREIPILAGDRLDCKIKSTITYNDEYQIIDTKYEILEVYGVIPPDKNDEKFFKLF